VRQKTVVLLLLVLLCYVLGLVTASYFPIPAHFGAVLTTLLQGKIRPFVVKRNFSETTAPGQKVEQGGSKKSRSGLKTEPGAQGYFNH